MSGNIIGERFLLVTFGESHGRVVGAVLDGCPAGLALKEDDIQSELDLRRPGQSIVTTQRKEEDRVEIMSGVFNGRTTGAPIMMLIRNGDKDSRPYDAMVNSPRPGHADLVAKMKYGGFNDYRGGGRFSGRITASFVMGGAVARKLLHEVLGVEIVAYSLEIGGIRAEGFDLDTARKNRYKNEARAPTAEAADLMKKKIIEARGGGNSLGGIVECVVLNVPPGLGEPVFASLDSDLARMALSIPAVKGVEFGSGFASARLKGTENNDEYYFQGDKIMTKTNNAGGILGGLSSGMPIAYRVAFKPASSVASKQTTVDLASRKEVELVVPGRHDPTVVPRAVPVVEDATALVLADHAIRAGMIPPVLRGP
ncbi:MAG: chorismate synthase [Nitrososphaerota archaeon]|nr:chorismate synthase [Nitrososphaerota archaeon]MDG6903207.1 chorismate synthase [Nitrososphaerota archaeon]MDG6911685.1 chorismate synthase [Nitrososphaerota archaeon]MDG6940587.1 chorismate synthase [Nitrososphaerota archaeon]MDG6960898.1 chorismate synthase [Nitrososphaerota archaeon]